MFMSVFYSLIGFVHFGMEASMRVKPLLGKGFQTAQSNLMIMIIIIGFILFIAAIINTLTVHSLTKGDD